MQKLYGVIAPVITPLKENGEVDYISLKKLTLSLIERGCDGIYSCGTTGGVVYYSLEERKKILETIWESAKGKAVVYAQVGGTILKDTLELAQHAYKLGVDGIGILTPTYFELSEEELENYYVTVAKSVPSDFPIYIYAIPGCAVNDVSPELAARIAEKCDNIVGIKYSKADFIRYFAFRQIRNGTFSVMVAPLNFAYAAFSIGCEGIVSGTCILFTEEIQALYTAFKRGDKEKALLLQKDLFERTALVNEHEMKKCKAFLCHEGIIATDTMRAPMQQMKEREKKEFFEGMESYKKNLSNLW